MFKTLSNIIMNFPRRHCLAGASWSSGMRTIFTGVLSSWMRLFSVMTRTYPSCLGCSTVICASGHLMDGVASLRQRQSCPTLGSAVLFHHFGRVAKLCTYSLDHRSQKCACILWMCCQRVRLLTSTSDEVESRTAVRAKPTRTRSAAKSSGSWVAVAEN